MGDSSVATHSALPVDKPYRIALAGDWHGDTDHACAVVRWVKSSHPR